MSERLVKISIFKTKKIIRLQSYQNNCENLASTPLTKLTDYIFDC